MSLSLKRIPEVLRSRAHLGAWLVASVAIATSVACSSSDSPSDDTNVGGTPTSSAGSGATTAGTSSGGGGSPTTTGGQPGTAGTVSHAGTTSTAGAGGTPPTAGSGAGGNATAGTSAGGSGGSPGTAGSGGSPAGGGGSGAGGSAGGGSGTFAPCPTTGACKILPFGDSITFGLLAPDYDTSKEGGYRAEIFTKAVAANQNITFLGSQSSGPTMVAGKAFPQKNEGHSGWTIDTVGSQQGISTLVPTPAFSTIPDIVLLMIGTNDAGKTLTAQQMADNLAKLIDNCIALAPNALFVVGKITPLSSAQSKVDTYNGLIPGIVQTRATAGKHILMVDHSVLTSGDLGDGVHPNAGGYVKMGDIWYDAIKTYLRTGT